VTDEIKYQPIEKQAIAILKDYNGSNNYLLSLKNEVAYGKLNLGRKTSEYVVKNYNQKVFGINQWFDIDQYFGEELQKKYTYTQQPTRIFIQKILSDTDKAVHVWAKVWEEDKFSDFWVPKICIIRKPNINMVDINQIDFTKYERKPYNYQIDGIKRLLENDRFILADDMGVGKAQPIDSDILTPNGWIKMKDVKIGESIIGSDGNIGKVIGVFPQGIKSVYKVKFSDNTETECCNEHLWSVQTINHKRRNKGFVIKSLSDLKKDLLISNTQNAKWFIPFVKPVKFKYKKINIDPYLLGCLIGDGCFTEDNRIQLSSNDIELINECQYRLPKGCKIRHSNKYSYYIDGNKKEIINDLKKLNLFGKKSDTKFIPNLYKYNSINIRLLILQGLMDTDGCCLSTKNTIKFGSSSKQLSLDVKEIVESLGGVARITTQKTHYIKNNIRFNCKPMYLVVINVPPNINCFKLTRKHILEKNNRINKKRYPTRGIEKIEFSRYAECQCILVNTKDNLYVTNNYILTHNTTQSVIAGIESNVKKILIVCPASLKLNWMKEIRLFDKESQINIIDSNKWISGGKWTIVNYDILKNFHTVPDKRKKNEKLITTIIDEKFDLIIGDEVQALKHNTSIRTKLFNDFSTKVKKLWLLTGTPITNRPMDFYNLLYLCNHRLARSWMGYVIRFCAGKQFYGRGGRRIWDTKGSSNLDELRESTKDVMLRRRKEDVLDLPDKIIQPIYLPLQHKDLYQQIVGEYQDWADHQENFNLAMHLAQLVKLRQFLAISKIESTIEIVENAIEEDKKVIIFTNFTEPLLQLQNHFGKKCVIHHGPMSKQKREESVERFQNDPDVKVFIGNIISAGVGINLTAAELVIFNDLSWLPADHLQSSDRAHRIGQKNTVNVYYNIIDETLDLYLFESLMKKMKVIDQVMGDSNLDEDVFRTVLQKIKK
jgi:superfamily II DNA or RNA helicase